MARRLTIILIWATIFLLSIPCFSLAEDNLLINGDFHASNEDGLPSDWYTDAYILEPGYSTFSLHEENNEHHFAAEIHNIGSNDARFAQMVEVEPESLYRLSGYILADHVEGGQGANLSVEGVYAFSEKCYDTNGKWKYIEYYGETGPDQHYITVFARLGGYSGESKGTASFSDLSLVKVTSLPGNIIADLWFTDSQEKYEDEIDDIDGSSSGASWPWMMATGIAYTLFSLFLIRIFNKRKNTDLDPKPVNNVLVFLMLISAFLLRLFISYQVIGYMVDVNCFNSWGYTMASVGPSRFYEVTNFCDYPPLYTYVLGLNSSIVSLIGGGENISQVVFRFVPSLCDIIACLLIYRTSVKQHINARVSFVFITLMAFNPATIMNSAAWGQMDSVLCLLLLIVALSAMKEKWIIALPVYMISVLVKPQALMLGPLGLIFIIMAWIKTPKQRKNILYGTGISILTMLIGIIPFSINQSWDWLIQLYIRTLSSYPYATVNTANFYYLLGGNWSAIGKTAVYMAPILLALFTAAYGLYWNKKFKNQPLHKIETIISFVFALGFILCAVLSASWAVIGGAAMLFAFVIVLSSCVRTGKIELLAYLGSLLFILLYVFGIKMHERYVFPALLLLAAAWTVLRDRRIIYLLLLFSLTLFLNEGIVLDNSIRLGSQMGHLNQDTVWLADIISILNCAGAVYAVWLNLEMMNSSHSATILEYTNVSERVWKHDRKLHWNRYDTIILTVITAIYSVITLLTLGSTKAPQTVWTSSSVDEQVVFDLGDIYEDFEILYFAQVSRNDFSLSASDDGKTWGKNVWAQMDQGQCWKWKYATESFEDGYGERTYFNSDYNHIIRFSGRYIKLNACQLGLKLNEILFRNKSGSILPAVIIARYGEESESELFSDPAALLDEQDTLEKTPALPEDNTTKSAPAQPSWWNSTYFDEIYHARTAYEFIQGSVPYETSHPPLGKVLMSAFILIFGMTPFGWRFAGAIAGILMLPGMYLLGKQLTKKTYIASFSCILMALDCMHLTQTQIATIDSFPVLFIIFAYFFMLRFMQTDYVLENKASSLCSLCFSGLFMGLAIASKWIGIYAGIGLAVLFFWHCFHIISIHPEKKKAVWRKFVYYCIWCILFFVIIPAIIYLASYIPYLAYKSKQIHSLGDYFHEILRSQIGMFNYHSTKNLGMDHPFYSPWWEWPIIGKPMYYASQQYIPSDFPVHHSIFCFGNPVIWYGGLAALVFCLYRVVIIRRYKKNGSDMIWHLCPSTPDHSLRFILIGFFAQYLPWVLVPRGTYIYHYFASLPFLMLAICYVYDANGQNKKIVRYSGIVLMLLAFIFFIILFPYASGINVPSSWLNIGKGLLKIWY